MFRLTRIPVAPIRREPVRLPITVTLAVPDDECVLREAHVFNVPGAIHYLLGSAGWDRLTKVVKPRVWAPGWSSSILADFVTRPFPKNKRPFPANAVEDLRASDVLPALSIGSNEAGEPRQIIHLLASFAVRERQEPALRLGARAIRSSDHDGTGVVRLGLFRDALVTNDTRLLILQVVDLSVEPALAFAQRLVGSGGPACLVVNGGTAAGLDQHFTDLYANIIHNQPISTAVRARVNRGGPDVMLFIGKRGEDTLQFDRWLDHIQSVFNDFKRSDEQLVQAVGGDKLRLLHARQVEQLKTKVRASVLGESAGMLIEDVARLRDIGDRISWAQETKGVIPLSHVAEAVPVLEFATRQLQRGVDPTMVAGLEAEARTMVETAPRVLNANFYDVRRRSLMTPDAPLERGRRYDLLIDIGPRWNTIDSIVEGSSGFPEAALPPRKKGHKIRVVFYSADFVAPGRGARSGITVPALETRDEQTESVFETVDLKPPSERFSGRFNAPYEHPVASTELWLPANSGRSHAIVGDNRAKKSGPARLSLLLPRTRGRGVAAFASGRLCIYYANNLLQSAVVTVMVKQGRKQRSGVTRNSITVDYVLTAGFSRVEQYERRQIGPEEDSASSYPIGLSIATNDGAAGHRLMIANRKDLDVWRPYDATNAEKFLAKMRSKLKECFWQRDDSCRLTGSDRTWKSGLNGDNGKGLKQFKCDLWQLAWYGSQVYARAFGQISDPKLVAYLQTLQAALESRTVISVARTGASQYVYPWALVYDIPLPDRNIEGALKWCPVIDKEWGEDGKRTRPPEAKCPHHGEADHDINTLCPYGFWGLKHFIEQPINADYTASESKPANGSALAADVLNDVMFSNPPAMAVALTRDAELDKAVLKTHLREIAKLATCTPADGADTWGKVQAMLAAPDIVYFLCHGEFDDEEDQPYIGIGTRDNDYQHRVYPDGLLQWSRTQPGFWRGRHPLVFVNGCHTADLEPGQILNFVTTFANLGASAFIGTEISIRLPLAVEVAEKLLKKIAAGETVGHAMHAVRWDLANKGNLLGLAYTPYGLSSLRFRHT